MGIALSNMLFRGDFFRLWFVCLLLALGWQGCQVLHNSTVLNILHVVLVYKIYIVLEIEIS